MFKPGDLVRDTEGDIYRVVAVNPNGKYGVELDIANTEGSARVFPGVEAKFFDLYKEKP